MYCDAIVLCDEWWWCVGRHWWLLLRCPLCYYDGIVLLLILLFVDVDYLIRDGIIVGDDLMELLWLVTYWGPVSSEYWQCDGDYCCWVITVVVLLWNCIMSIWYCVIVCVCSEYCDDVVHSYYYVCEVVLCVMVIVLLEEPIDVTNCGSGFYWYYVLCIVIDVEYWCDIMMYDIGRYWLMTIVLLLLKW